MSKEDEEILMVCVRADGPMVVPGTVFTHSCADCGASVILAPTGHGGLRQNPAEKVICIPCLVKRYIADQLPSLVAPVEQILAEMRSARPNFYRNRN